MPVRAKRQRVEQRFQFRLLWKYKGAKKVHELRSDTPAPALNMLRRVATTTPWMGVTKGQLRKAWARLQMRLELQAAAIKHFGPREVIQKIQDTFPELEWVRVEHRQVGEWVEQINPLVTLHTEKSIRADKRTVKMFETIEAMTSEELDAWRKFVSPEYLAGRKANSNNRELVRE